MGKVEQLPHTARMEELKRAGVTKAERAKEHNARVASELARAKAGAVINLSDLMAAKDNLTVEG